MPIPASSTPPAANDGVDIDALCTPTSTGSGAAADYVEERCGGVEMVACVAATRAAQCTEANCQEETIVVRNLSTPTQFLDLSEDRDVIRILDALLLSDGHPNRVGYALRPDGRAVDWDAVAQRLSSTEASALAITRCLASLEPNGRLPVGHPWHLRLSSLLTEHGF